MCQTLNLQIITCFLCPNRSCSDWGLSVSSMVGGLFSWWVFIHLSFTRKWLVIGMPSSMLKSNQNIISNKTPPGLLFVWTVTVVSDQPWSVLVGGGGVKTLPFCLGTAYNVSSMEDIEISWLLCWEWKHTAQNYIHLCFKARALAPLQIPASLYEGLIYLLLLLSHHPLIKSTR